MKNEPSYHIERVDRKKNGVKYVVKYVDFTGITGGGNTKRQAIKVAKEALNMFIEYRKKEGRIEDI